MGPGCERPGAICAGAACAGATYAGTTWRAGCEGAWAGPCWRGPRCTGRGARAGLREAAAGTASRPTRAGPRGGGLGEAGCEGRPGHGRAGGSCCTGRGAHGRPTQAAWAKRPARERPARERPAGPGWRRPGCTGRDARAGLREAGAICAGRPKRGCTERPAPGRAARGGLRGWSGWGARPGCEGLGWSEVGRGERCWERMGMGNARPGGAGRFGVGQRRPTTLTQSLPSAGESQREPSKTARHVPDVRAGTRVEK